MSFKNAIKLVFTKFNMVWAKLAAILVSSLVVIGLCIDPILSMYSWLENMGFIAKLAQAWTAYSSNGNIVSLLESFLRLSEQFFNYYVSHPGILWDFTLKFGFLILGVYKFLLTTFELGFSKQIYGIMSDNSKPGFWVSYISQFGKSLGYSLVKTVTFMIYDSVTLLVLYLVLKAVSGVPLLIPFVVMLVLIVFLTFRSSLFFAWLPYITVDNRNMMVALGKSIILFFKNFAKVFSAYLISWICIISLCVFLTVFTFGVALIIAVPVCSMLLAFLNMTLFYSSNGMRYYMDDKIFDVNYIN
ncbi:MAG: hypothetical protein J6C23_05790 [Clostridia bacterium]|nr:hypothetical protein [Clostridia bacterium]